MKKNKCPKEIAVFVEFIDFFTDIPNCHDILITGDQKFLLLEKGSPAPRVYSTVILENVGLEKCVWDRESQDWETFLRVCESDFRGYSLDDTINTATIWRVKGGQAYED